MTAFKPTGSAPAVFADTLIKSFGEKRAVDQVSFEVAPGEILGVLGPNGAGKTTVLRMLATLLRIDSGRAAIFGFDVASQPHQVRQLLGVTGQYASVDEQLTAIENLWMFGRLHGLPATTARRRADELLGQFGLEEAAKKPLSAFSGGMRRRLDLAASLITRAPLIFLDEPTTGLDPRTRGMMWDTIRDLVSAGSTILLTTQYLDEADQLADRILVIDEGRVVAQGAPDALKRQVGRSTLKLRLDDPDDGERAAPIAAAALGVPTVSIGVNGLLHAPLAAATQTAEVLVALAKHGIGVAAISVDAPTLDEVFFALTGHGTHIPEATEDSPNPDRQLQEVS